MPSLDEQEEFEFRLRAEQERAPQKPAQPKEQPLISHETIAKYGGGAGETVADLLGLDKGKGREFGEHVATSAEANLNALARPLDTLGKGLKAIPGALEKAGQVAMNPVGSAVEAIDRISKYGPAQWGDVVGGTLSGAGIGKVARLAGDFAGGAKSGLFPKAPVNPDVAKLAARGVQTMTPAQRGGGALSTVEQKLESVPIAGDIIKKARQRPLEEWNRADVNEALKTVGEKPLPRGIDTGHDAIAYAYEKMGARYDAVLSKMSGDLNAGTGTTKAVAKQGGHSLPMPGSFKEALEKVRAVGRGLPADQAKALNTLIDNEVIGKFTTFGKASGETLQDIGETLRSEANEYRNSSSPHDRKLANAIDQIRNDMDTMLLRQNPKVASEFKDLRKGYAQFSAASETASRAMTKGGVYTPGQKLQTVRRKDVSKGKGASARGQAPGQQDALSAQRVLGNTVPSSGTSERGMMAVMAKEILENPIKGTAMAAALGIPTSILYSRPVMKWLQEQSLKAPKTAGKGARQVPVVAGAVLGTQQPGTDEAGVVR